LRLRTRYILGAFTLSILALTYLNVVATFSTVYAADDPYWIPYSQIGPTLREIEKTSNRVRVEVIGQSAGGRDLYLAIVSAPEAMGRLGVYQAIRQQMVKDPSKAQEMIDTFGDFKVPFYVQGSIHGTEYPGVDAVIRLIKTLAYDDTPEVRTILDNVILLANVDANPDGRVLGTRGNANGFDLNRDFITQSQPETRAAVSVFTEWNPMVVLDLHGFSRPMLIEPCTPPHNPNYEYDLYITWALAEAKAMEDELLLQTGFSATIPFRDEPEGWDDWPPIFNPMYAMYHGAYGHTLETPYNSLDGVAADYAAVWGALKFVSQNRKDMIRDQIEVFRRGLLGLPHLPIPQEILDQAKNPWDPYDYLTTFPAAYVIPKEKPLQQSPHQAARVVDFLIFNDIQVEQASDAFTLNGVDYPKGTYVVWLNQPKRGLAITILWDGWDISYAPQGGLDMYDISGWSHTYLWGFSRQIMPDRLDIKSNPINRADPVTGFVEGGKAQAYAYLPTSNEAIEATNELLTQGISVYRATKSFVDSGREFSTGTFIIPATKPNVKSLANHLSSEYGLDVLALQALPSDTTLMRKQKIAVIADEGVRFFLKEYGFNFTVFTIAQLNSGTISLTGYDVFINSGSSRLWSGLNSIGKATISAFFAAGGDLVGLGPSGADLSSKTGLLVVTYKTGLANDNGIVKLTYDPYDTVTTQYPSDSYGFVYRPLWFTSSPPNAIVSARITLTSDFFVAGFWRNWETSGAAGYPVILHGTSGASDVVLFGIDPTFRAHPEFTFATLANAIWTGLD